MTEKEIEEKLFALKDEKYGDFQAKLMPGIDRARIIGVRTPLLRSLAKQIVKEAQQQPFLSELPHAYYDEYNLHGFLISECRDYEEAVKAVDALLPYVDNWATCDLLSPKAFKKNRERLIHDIRRWIRSDRVYTVRFGLEMIMSHFLDEDFRKELLEEATAVRSEEYYVNMMIAWLFATALAKHWDDTIGYIEDRRLAPWVHNKTIQKACESYRITPEQKELLRGRKVKG